jgi:hypothetical protein
MPFHFADLHDRREPRRTAANACGNACCHLSHHTMRERDRIALLEGWTIMGKSTFRTWKHGPVAAAGVLLFCACGVHGVDGAGQGSAERTASESAALTSPSPSMGPFKTGLGTVRPVVAVGPNHVLTTNAGNAFRIYQRNPGDATGAGTPYDWIGLQAGTATLPGSGTHTFSGSLSSIFQPVISYLNANPPAADAGTPTSSLLPACSVTSGLGSNSQADTGCIFALYDGDAYYDPMYGRFFIMQKAKRNVVPCVPTGSPYGYYSGASTNVCVPTSANYAAATVARTILVAVSPKCDVPNPDCGNPAKWKTYALASQYHDWSQLMVTRGLVMVNYRGQEPQSFFTPAPDDMWIYSEQQLVNGVDGQGHPLPLYLPAPLNHFTADDFSKGLPGQASGSRVPGPVMFVKQPAPTAQDLPFFIAYSGGPSKLWVYNLYPTTSTSALDLGSAGVTFSITPPATITLPTAVATQQVNGDRFVPAAYDSGVLTYSTSAPRPGDTTNSFIDTIRIPVQSVAPANPGGGAPPFSAALPELPIGLSDVGTSYGFPVTHVVPSGNVTAGNVMTAFHTWTQPSPGSFQITAKYAVAPGGAGYEDPFQISGPTGSANQPPSAAGEPDILSTATDPIFPDQFFMTSITETNGGGTSWLTAALTAPLSMPTACNTDNLYLNINNSPLEVTQGSNGQAFVLMCGPWIAHDLGNGAIGAAIPSTSTLPGATFPPQIPGTTIDSEGAIQIAVTAPLNAVPGLYTVQFQATDLWGPTVTHTTTIPIQVLACAPPSPSICTAGMCGVWNANDCGGVNCGVCPTGDFCSSGHCCATGSTFNGTVCQPNTCPAGTSWCANQEACLTDAQCNPPCPPLKPLCPDTGTCMTVAACNKLSGGGGSCTGTHCM